MDDISKRIAGEIAAAIAKAAAADSRVEAWREIAEAAGFEVTLSLEAAIASGVELSRLPADRRPAPVSPMPVPVFDLTATDLRLLKSLHISVDRATEPA